MKLSEQLSGPEGKLTRELKSRGYLLPLGRRQDDKLTFAKPEILDDLMAALMLPGDVYAGRVAPMSQEAIERGFDLAGAVTLGAGAVPMKAGQNVLRMGAKAPGERASLTEALLSGRLTRDDPGGGPPVSAALPSGARGGTKVKHYMEALSQHGVEISPDDAARLRADSLAISDIRSQRARQILGAKDNLDRPQYPPTARLKDKRAAAARATEAARQGAREQARIARMQEFVDQGIWRKDFAARAMTDARIGTSGEATKATLEAVPRLLAKDGWTVRHASKGDAGRKSSRYIVSPDGKFEVRLSDHYLPDTPQREYSRQFSGPRWNDEVVIDDGTDPREVLEAIRASYRAFMGGE